MIGIAFRFVVGNWMPFAFGALLLGLITYHRCAVSEAREVGRQEGQVEVREVIALEGDDSIRQLAEREQELNERLVVRENALDNQWLAFEQAQKDFLRVQADFHLSAQRSMDRFSRRLEDAGREAANVPVFDLVPMWDSLLAEHGRRDAAAGPRNDTGTQ